MKQMKHTHLILKAGLTFVMFMFAINVFAAKPYVQGKYNIDPVHTRVSFVIPHFVISVVEGRFDDVSGEFTLAEPFAASSASVNVAIKSIDTGVKKRDDDLRSKNFFDEAKYPTMKFVSKSVSGTPESFKVVGALTIKDVTKEVTLDGKYTGSLKDPWGNQRVALQLSGIIQRTDFHISYHKMTEIGPDIGDDVTIRIWVDGTLAKK